MSTSSDPLRPRPTDQSLTAGAGMHVGPGGYVDLKNLFTYHPPHGTQESRYRMIREMGLYLAEAIAAHCPPSTERTTALAKVREAVMWSNASIAVNEKPEVDLGPRPQRPGQWPEDVNRAG